MTLDYLHFENALRFKHVELCVESVSTVPSLLCTLVITVQKRPGLIVWLFMYSAFLTIEFQQVVPIRGYPKTIQPHWH